MCRLLRAFCCVAMLYADHGQMSRRRTKLKFQDHFDFDHPERELFLWAILFNRRDLTHLFWRIGRDHLGEIDVISDLTPTAWNCFFRSGQSLKELPFSKHVLSKEHVVVTVFKFFFKRFFCWLNVVKKSCTFIAKVLQSYNFW